MLLLHKFVNVSEKNLEHVSMKLCTYVDTVT